MISNEHMHNHPLFGELKITRKKSGYSRGKDGYSHILYAALDILIEDGYNAISFRNIANACDMKVGNVSYYFSSKQELLRQLLQSIIGHYEDMFDEMFEDATLEAEHRLTAYIAFIIDDLRTKKTTRLFPELWALGNHDEFAAERIEALYRRARSYLHDIIIELNPTLPAKEREILALFISASMEGLTVFAGYKKPWVNEVPALTNLATRSFLELVKNIKVSEIRDMK